MSKVNSFIGKVANCAVWFFFKLGRCGVSGYMSYIWDMIVYKPNWLLSYSYNQFIHWLD